MKPFRRKHPIWKAQLSPASLPQTTNCFFPAMIIFLCVVRATLATSGELSGYVAAEGRLFFKEALLSEQERNNGSLSFQSEYYHEWENGPALTFVPFARIDSADSQRSHFDIRELNCLWSDDWWELRAGIGKVFWGATEFVHLVDIINQTDLVENIDGEEKLGQPMVHFAISHDWGAVDLFLLPWFRERTFPGSKGRLRSALVVDTDNPVYESPDEEHHMDFAVRYSRTMGSLDMGIAHFNGTGREPTLRPGHDPDGIPVLIPFYRQIRQTSVDLQFVAGEWLWKLETLHRSGQEEAYFAGVGGFEYTFFGIFGTAMDTGLLWEWAYDDRGNKAATPFENDVMFGLRLNVNDAAGSEILAGVSLDLDSPAKIITLEANRRFGNNIKIILEANAFLGQPEDDLLSSLRNDDFLRIESAFYF